ncbi:MAG: hypothetical protein U0324_11925 [Polyangiales bacterium]
MKYQFVEPVVLSPREVRLDVALMRRLHARWSRQAHADDVPPPAAAPAAPAADAPRASRVPG